MLDREAYFRRIGYPGPAGCDLATLRALHKRHLMSVAFDNSDAVQGRLSDVHLIRDVDLSITKIVTGRRGGICFELNGPFRELLADLRFDTIRIAAGVRQPSGAFGPDLSHMFTVVRLDGAQWLADVGFPGPSFLEPVLLSDEPQEQYGCAYKVISNGERHVLCRRPRGGRWTGVYRFTLIDRGHDEWDGFASGQETLSPESLVGRIPVYSRAFETGQSVLLGRRLVTVDDGYESVTTLSDSDEYQKAVDDLLR